MSSQNRAQIGVIGGSGLYDPDIFLNRREIKVFTPYGETSDLITLGEMEGKSVAFLPRHGRRHRIPPHKINYRANMWALKELGVKWVISVSAVGSLNLQYKPGDFVVPDQFIDMTKGRQYTFYDGPVVAHVSMAEPFCNSLRKIVIESAERLKITTHPKGTYICIEGPRFSTKAESIVWKEVFKADVIGMTLVPEVNLACEAEMCYSTIAMVTDYDVFAEIPVTAEEVTKVMSENTSKAKNLLREIIRSLPEKPDERECSCCHSLKTALV
ncbi:S-methyl-5'-thioadenosine phosphorylase [Metallosphaera hakonensis]|uniref:S-methyl-5'-thioadenosine phosphorylase n=1 Tax=Metallosphaera hakonensis JCM 8857 = DSM 7519 TaxID=1293036 RepID=A0A2U9IS51_9CREN|nr:S-methyl-5'-thioadenosine phosphorylase [Metallosphaera hakonensis]AWR98862.1 S-methyl-5'-thioadenosine phosphorylase [Metallosphaera hakonensis JCM 8857 = DSM 7519]